MQWTEAWLDTVDGIEDRCRDQRDDATGDVWSSPRCQDRGVHHTDPLQHRVGRGSRHLRRTNSEQRRYQQKRHASRSRTNTLVANRADHYQITFL